MPLRKYSSAHTPTGGTAVVDGSRRGEAPITTSSTRGADVTSRKSTSPAQWCENTRSINERARSAPEPDESIRDDRLASALQRRQTQPQAARMTCLGGDVTQVHIGNTARGPTSGRPRKAPRAIAAAIAATATKKNVACLHLRVLNRWSRVTEPRWLAGCRLRLLRASLRSRWTMRRHVPVRSLFVGRLFASLRSLCAYRMVQGSRFLWSVFGTAVALVGLIVPVALVLQSNQNRLSRRWPS